MRELIDVYGLDVVQAYMGHIQVGGVTGMGGAAMLYPFTSLSLDRRMLRLQFATCLRRLQPRTKWVKYKTDSKPK